MNRLLQIRFLLAVVSLACLSLNTAKAQFYETYQALEHIPGAFAGYPFYQTLPDNSVYHLRGNTLRRINPEGDFAWRKRLSVRGEVVGLDTIGNDCWVASCSQSGNNLVLQEELTGFDGNITAFNENIFYEVADNRILEDRVVVIEKIPDSDELVCFFNTDTLGGLPRVRFFDSTHVVRLNGQREVIESISFNIGEGTGLMNAHALSDGSYALIVESDMVFDGIYSGEVLRLIHLQQDGSYTVLDTLEGIQFRPEIGLLGQDRIALLESHFGFPESFWEVNYYDFRTDSKSHTFRFDFLPSTGGGTSIRGLADKQEVVVLVGGSDWPADNKNFVEIKRFDREGEMLFSQRYSVPSADNLAGSLEIFPDGSYFMSGLINIPNAPLLHFLHVDTLGRTLTNEIAGYLRPNEGDTCLQDSLSPGLGEIWLKIIPETPERDTLYAYTEADGYFQMRIDTGAYSLEVIRRNAYWEACPAIPFRVLPGVDTTWLKPALRKVYDCPLVSVGISNYSAEMNRCGQGAYKVSYRNQGVLPASSALLRVTLDEEFTPTSSFPNWDLRLGDTLFYNLGEQTVGAYGDITIVGDLSCEESIPGQTHCSEAKVFPDSLCTPPGVSWDGSSVAVSGECTGDSIVFRIINNGLNDMQEPLQYVIVEDIIMHLGGQFQLSVEDTLEIRIPATGRTYRLEAEQSLGHPGNSQPSVTVEGCGQVPLEEISTGIFGQYPQDDDDPFVAIDCTPNNGAERDGLLSDDETGNKQLQEPSILRLTASPRGIGPDRLVDPGGKIYYHLAFQNLTDKTIWSLVIKDTLGNSFDPATLEIIGSSHELRFESNPSGIVGFHFADLELAAEELLFVKFSVKQVEDIRPGMILTNRAGVSWGGKPYRGAIATPLQIRKPQRYAFTGSRNCFPASPDLPSLIRRLDTLRLPDYDSVTLQIDTLLPAYAIELDTSVHAGDTLWDITILTDTSFVRRLKTETGCDSLLTVSVMATPNALGNPAAVNDLLLYPNPAQGYVILRIPDSRSLSSLELRDLLGRRYSLNVGNRQGDGLLLDLRNLPSGTYFVHARGVGNWRWQGKLMLR